MKNVKITDLVWDRYFIGEPECFYHRKTLIECGIVRYIVTTTEKYCGPERDSTQSQRRWDRYYETFSFAKLVRPYWDVESFRPNIVLDEWAIFADSHGELPDDIDSLVDHVHDNAVAAICETVKKKASCVLN